MVWTIVKKQLLLLWRNPLHLLLLLGLPIVLIFILGTGLSGLMNQETPDVDIRVAILNHGDEKQEIARFLEEMEETVREQVSITEIEESMDNVAPMKMLENEVLGNDALKEMIEVGYIKEKDKEAALQDYTAVIEIPEDFTYHFLQNMFLENEIDLELVVHGNKESSLGFSIVQSLLQRFEENYALGQLSANYDLDEHVLQSDGEEVFGEITSVNQEKPVQAKHYYTVAMAVMNVLFIASTISFYTFEEKRLLVFDRILLANVSRWKYFFGIFLSGIILALVQLGIIFGFSRIFFGVSWPNPSDMMIFTFALSIAIGGLTVFLTSINYRLHSEVVTTIFSSIIIYVMALLGGSFFPIGQFSDVISSLGNVTPNGAALSAYLNLLRGNSLASVSNYIYFLIGFGLVFLLLAMMTFPKRRESR